MGERGRTWSDQEIAALMAKWADETIQAQLLRAARNVRSSPPGNCRRASQAGSSTNTESLFPFHRALACDISRQV